MSVEEIFSCDACGTRKKQRPEDDDFCTVTVRVRRANWRLPSRPSEREGMLCQACVDAAMQKQCPTVEPSFLRRVWNMLAPGL